MSSIVDKIRRIPGETFRLPSLGFGYDEDVFDVGVKNGEIEVFPMSTYEEILLKTPELLLSGVGVFEAIANKVPCIKRPDKLSHKDVDFVLTCLRKVTYGDDIPVQFTHNCEGAKSHSYLVKLSPFISQTKYLDPIKAKEQFTVRLPNDQVVMMNTITFRDVLELTQLSFKFDAQETMTVKEMEDSNLLATSAIIKSVDDETNKEVIMEWLTAIPVQYRNLIRDKISEASKDWGIEFETEIVCKDCGKQVKLTPTLNPVSFFT